jgi:hypothetical protein
MSSSIRAVRLHLQPPCLTRSAQPVEAGVLRFLMYNHHRYYRHLQKQHTSSPLQHTVSQRHNLQKLENHA